PPWYAEHVEPEGIEQDIRRTRSEMDETLDALGEKLNPRHLLDGLIDYFRGPRSEGTGTRLKDEALHVAGRFSRNLMHQVAEHPLPSLLIGAGLAWLVYEQGEEEEDYGYPTR